MQRFDSFLNWQPLLEDARQGPGHSRRKDFPLMMLPPPAAVSEPAGICCQSNLCAREPLSQRLPCASEARPCWTLSDPARRSAGRLRPLPNNLQRFTSPLPFSFTPDEVAEALAQPSAAWHPGCQASRPITSMCFSAILTRCQQTKKMKNRAHTRQRH